MLVDFDVLLGPGLVREGAHQALAQPAIGIAVGGGAKARQYG